MAILTVSNFAIFAGLLVAGQKLAMDPNPVNQVKALADLASGANSLAAVLNGSGLAPLAKEMEARARDADAAFARDPGANDARAIFWQVVAVALTDPMVMTAGALDAGAVTDGMIRIIDASPHGSDFARTPMAESYFRAVVHPTLTTLLSSVDFLASIAPDLWRRALRDNGIQIELLERLEAKFDVLSDNLGALLTAQLEETIRPFAALNAAHQAEIVRLSNRVQEAGLTEARFIALANRVGQDVLDVDSAFVEIERAITVAIEVQARGVPGSSTDEFVNAVLARMAALSAENRDDEAATEADHAYDEWKQREMDRREREAQNGITILEAGLRADILRRDPTSAARRILQRAELESPDRQQRLANLTSSWLKWHGRGRNTGSLLDLEISIEIARHALDIAGSSEERSDSFMRLARSFASRGERDVGVYWQEKALEAINAASNLCSRDGNSIRWACVQSTLGDVLGELGDRQGRIDRLKGAIAAYHGALKVYKRTPFPRNWAGTHLNIGIAYRRIGLLEDGTKSLKKAVEKIGAALLEFHPETNTDDWALAQMTLGNALQTLGDREGSSKRLLQAVAAYRASLSATTRATQSVDWAMRRSLLSAALWTLGDRQESLPTLKRAAAAVRPALRELQGRNLLRDWVAGQGQYGNALRSYGKLTENVAILECAVAAYHSALSAMSRESLPTAWALIKDNLARGLASIADLTDRNYAAAFAEIDEAIAVFRYLGAAHYLRRAAAFRESLADR